MSTKEQQESTSSARRIRCQYIGPLAVYAMLHTGSAKEVAHASAAWGHGSFATQKLNSFSGRCPLLNAVSAQAAWLQPKLLGATASETTFCFRVLLCFFQKLTHRGMQL